MSDIRTPPEAAATGGAPGLFGDQPGLVPSADEQAPGPGGPAPARPSSWVRRWWPWAVMAVLVVGALAVGAAGAREPATLQQRVDALAQEVRCPTCRSESAAESDAPSARAIRTDIARRFEAGQSADEVRAYLVSRYGQEILLTPSAEGAGSVVWVLPVVLIVLGAAGLAVAFRRWRPDQSGEVTDDDRAVVAAAQERRHHDDPAPAP